MVVVASGDDGKPRPAVVSQTNALPDTHASVVICQMTSDIADAPDFRVSVEPTETNGLRLRSQIMADKPVTVVRRRIGQTIRRIGQEDPGRLNAALAFVIGLAD